jgi:hypothetical protein
VHEITCLFWVAVFSSCKAQGGRIAGLRNRRVTQQGGKKGSQNGYVISCTFLSNSKLVNVVELSQEIFDAAAFSGELEYVGMVRNNAICLVHHFERSAFVAKQTNALFGRPFGKAGLLRFQGLNPGKQSHHQILNADMSFDNSMNYMFALKQI